MRPKQFQASKRIEQLQKPKTVALKNPKPFMHADFRGLLHADHAEAVSQCFSSGVLAGLSQQQDAATAFSQNARSVGSKQKKNFGVA